MYKNLYAIVRSYSTYYAEFNITCYFILWRVPEMWEAITKVAESAILQIKMATLSSRITKTTTVPFDQIVDLSQKCINDNFLRLWNEHPELAKMD